MEISNSFHPLGVKTWEYLMGYLEEREKERLKNPLPLKAINQNFVCKYGERGFGGAATYEIYKGVDAESARECLLTKRIDKKLYYMVVEMPEGNWGIDVEGLYLKRLPSWQTNISSATMSLRLRAESHF